MTWVRVIRGDIENATHRMQTELEMFRRVAEAGSISVTLSSGMKRAVGYGRLTATSGSGTWRGAMCSGTWTAQRI